MTSPHQLKGKPILWSQVSYALHQTYDRNGDPDCGLWWEYYRGRPVRQLKVYGHQELMARARARRQYEYQAAVTYRYYSFSPWSRRSAAVAPQRRTLSGSKGKRVSGEE